MKTTQANIPLTVRSSTSGEAAMVLGAIGGPNYQKIPNPIQGQDQGYWMAVLSRIDLKVHENFYFNDASSVPPKLSNYLGDSNFFFILVTQGAYNSILPVGPFYQWLLKEGAGVQLKGLEQRHAALNCGGFYEFNYMLVDVFGQKFNSLEFSETEHQNLTVAVELQPISSNGQTLYTPVNLQ